MGMQLPEWVRTMFMVTTGDGWPEADEDGLRALAREWSSVGEAIDGLEQRLGGPVQVGRRAGWHGPAADSFTAAQLVLAGPGNPQLNALGQGSRELSKFIDDTSASVEYMKLIVAGQLVILAGQIAYMASMAVSTFGASSAGIPAVQAAGRAFAVTAVRQLVAAFAVGEVLQVGLDASIQALQKFVLHTRRDWDESLTSNAAITGAIGAALGPALGALGSVASRAASQAVGKVAAEAVEQIGVSAVHEYATAVGTGLATGQGFVGKIWDVTAGATDGATDAAGHLLRRRHGGAAPDVSTLPDITVAVSPGHFGGAPQTVPSVSAGPGSPAVGGPPTSPATAPATLGEARPVAAAAPTSLDPAQLPATVDPGDSPTAGPGDSATAGPGDPPPTGPGGSGAPDDPTGTAASALSAPAVDQSPPPILTMVKGTGAPSSESAAPAPRRRTPDRVPSTTDAAVADSPTVADSATDEGASSAPQSPTRRAQPVRRAAEQRDEAAVGDVDEKTAVPVGEAVPLADSADLVNPLRASAWTGSSESAPSSPSAASSASERGDDLSDAEVTAASVDEVVSQTPDESADPVEALRARLWASNLQSPLIWRADSESDGDFSDGERSLSDPGMPILDSQLRTGLWRVYSDRSTELSWSGAPKSAPIDPAAVSSVLLARLTATAGAGTIIKAVRDLPPARRADAIAWLTTRRAELRQRLDELMEQLGGRTEHPVKDKYLARRRKHIPTLNSRIRRQEQRLAKLEARLAQFAQRRTTDVQGLLANLNNVRTSLMTMRREREFLLQDLQDLAARPLRDELVVVRREAQRIDRALPVTAQLLVEAFTHDLVYVADADVIVDAINNSQSQREYAYAVDWLGTRRRELHQALTELDRQLDPDTIQRLNADYADLRQIDVATGLKDGTRRAYLERVLLHNESDVVDQVLSKLVRPALAYHHLTFVRVEPGSDSLWNSVIAVADQRIRTKLETHDSSRNDSVGMLTPDLIRQFVADQVQAPAALVARIRSGDAGNDAGAIVELVGSELDLSLKLVETGQDTVLDPKDGRPLILIRHGNDFCAAIPDDTVARLDRELTAHRDRLLRAKLDEAVDEARRRLIDATGNISSHELQTLRNLLRTVAVQGVLDQPPSGDSSRFTDLDLFRQELDAEFPVARLRLGLEAWRVNSGRLRQQSWSDGSSSDGEMSLDEMLSRAAATRSADAILNVVRKSSPAERVESVAWLSNRRAELGQRLEELAEQVGRYAEQGVDRGGFDQKYVIKVRERIAELEPQIDRYESRLKVLEGYLQDAKERLDRQGGGSVTTAVGGYPAMALQWRWELNQLLEALGPLRAQREFHEQDLLRAPLRAEQATVQEELHQINSALPYAAEMLVDGQMRDLVFVADVDVISEAVRTLPNSERGRVSDWLGTRRRELGDRLAELERGLDLGVERRFDQDLIRFWELNHQLAGLADGPERAQVEQELATLAPYEEWARVCHEVDVVDQVLNGMIQPYLSALGLTLVRVQPGPDSLWDSLITVADEQIRATLGSAYLGRRPGAVALSERVRGFVADGLPAEASAELVARVRSGDAGDQAGRIVELAARDLGLALTVVDHRPATTMDPQDGVPAHLVREGNDFSAMVPTSTIDRLDAELAGYRERLAGYPRFTKLDEQIGVVRGQLVDATGVVSARLLMRQRDLLRAMAELEQTRSVPYAPSVETLIWHMEAYTAQVKDIVASSPSEHSQQVKSDATTLEREFDDLRSQLGDGRDAGVVDRMDETVEAMRALSTWLREAVPSSTRGAAQPAVELGIDWHWSEVGPELANGTARERFWSALRLEPSCAVVVETNDGTKLVLRAEESGGVPAFVIEPVPAANSGPGTPTSVPLHEIAHQLRDRGVVRGRLPITEQQLTVARYCSGDPDVELTAADKSALIDQFLDRGTARDQDAVVNLLWFSDNADLAALFNPQGFGQQPSDQLRAPATIRMFAEGEDSDGGYPFLNRIEERIVGDAGERLADFLAARFEGGRAQLREGMVVPRGNPPARVDPLSLGERAEQRLDAAVDDAGTVSAALQHEPADPSGLDYGPRDGSLRRFDRLVATEPMVETHIVRLPETEQVQAGYLQAPGVSSGSAALSSRGLVLARVRPGPDSLWDSLIVVADEQIRATLGSAYLGPRPGAVALYPELVREFVADRLPAEASAELVARVRSGDAGDQAGRIMELAAQELGLALTVVDGDHETLVGRQDGVPAYLVRERDDFAAAIPASTIVRLDRELAGYRASLADPDLFTKLANRFGGVRARLVDDAGVVSGRLLQTQRGLLRAMAGLVQIQAAHIEPNVENLTEQMEFYTAEFGAIVATVPDEGRRGRLQGNVDTMMRQFNDARSAANGTDAAALDGMISTLRRMQRFVTKLGVQQALSESGTPEQARRNEFGVHPVQPDQVRSDDSSQMDDGAEAGPVRRVHRAEVPRPMAETMVVTPPETGQVTLVDPQGWAASSSAAAAQSHAPVAARVAGVADTHVLDQALVLPIVLADPGQPGPDDSRMAYNSYHTGISHNQWQSADVAERARLLCDAVERQQIDSAAKVTTGAGARSWVQLLGATQQSGHKLHVAAGSLAEVRNALRRIAPVLLRAGLGVAAARREDVLWDTHGLGLTISLPRRATIHRDVSLVAAALAGYQPSVAKLAGETQLAPGLFHRFEFGWDLGIDLDTSTTENERRHSQLMYARRPDGAPLADRLTREQAEARREHLRQTWRLDDNDLVTVGETVGNPTFPWTRKSQDVLRLEVAGLYCALHGRPETGEAWNVEKLLELRRVSEWIRKNYPQAAAQPTVPLTAQDLRIVVRQVVEPGANLTSETAQALADLVHKYPRGSVADLAKHARRDAVPEFRRDFAVAVNRRSDALQQALSVPGSPIGKGYIYANEDVKALASLVVDKYLDPRANPHDDRFNINDYRRVVRDVLGTTRPTVQDLAALANLVHLVRTGQVRSVSDRMVTVSNLRRATAEWPLQPAHQRRLFAEPIEVEMRTLTRRMYARLAGDAIEQTRQPVVRQQFAQVMAEFYDTRARLNTVDPDDAAPLLTELSRGVQQMQDLLAGTFEPGRQAVNQRLPFDPDDLRQRLETESAADIAGFVTRLSSPDRSAAMTWLASRRIEVDSEATVVQMMIGTINETKDPRNGAAETEQDLYDPLEGLREDSQSLARDLQKLDDVLSHLNESPLSESPGRTEVAPPARPLRVDEGAGAGPVRRLHRAETPQPMVETHTIRPPETGQVFVGSQESVDSAASHPDDIVAAVQPPAGAERQAATSQLVARLTELRQEIAELDDVPAIRDGRFDALYVAELTDDSVQAFADAERLAAEIGELDRQLRELDAATGPGGIADGGPDLRASLRQELQSLVAQRTEAEERWGDKQNEILLTEARRVRSELQYEAEVISAELTALGGPIGEIEDVPQPVASEPESPRGLPSDTEQQFEPESDEELADLRQRIAALRLVDPTPAVDRTESDSHRDGDETVFFDEDWSELESELADEAAQEQFESATVTEPYAPVADVSERLDAYLQGYAQLRGDLGALALSESDVRTVAGALAQLAGGGFAGDPAQVFDNREIGVQLARVVAQVAERGRVAADRQGLRSTLNLLLLSAAWVPVEAGTGRAVPVVSRARLVQVLRDVADDLSAGRDPMVASEGSRSPLAVIGGDQSRPVAERLAQLALLNLDPAVAAGVARSNVFGRLLGSGLAGEALYATSGVEQPLALPTTSLAPVSRAVGGQVPTIVGLVAVGHRMVDDIAARVGQHEPAHESVVRARREFTSIETGTVEVVERFDVDGDRVAARRALDALTTRWRSEILTLAADVSAVLPATDCARAVETALASPLLSGRVVLTPEVATAEAASRLWAAVHGRPGQGILVESGHGVQHFLGARIVDGASVFVLEDGHSNRSETFTCAQAGQGLADAGIVAGYLHSPQWELASEYDNGGSAAVELPLDTKAVLIHELLERGLSKDQHMAMMLLETSYDEEVQALLPQEDVLLVGGWNNDERMAQISREPSDDDKKVRLRKKSAQPMQVEVPVPEVPDLFAQLDSAITDSSAAARLRSFLDERIDDGSEAADAGELKAHGYPQWRFGPRALSERLDLRYGTDRWRQVLTDALGHHDGKIRAKKADAAAQYVAQQVAKQMMTTSMFERVNSLPPAERTLAIRWLWQEREFAVQDARNMLVRGEEGPTPLQISDEMLRSVGLNPDWVYDATVRTPLVHRPLSEQELNATVVQEMADRFLAIDQYRHQVAGHLHAVLAGLGTITDANLQTAAVSMDRAMDGDLGAQIAAELQALPSEPRARVIGWLTAHREQLAERTPAARTADEVLIALGLRSPLEEGETDVAPRAPSSPGSSSPGSSIADRLRGLVAVTVSADPGLFAPPSWAELRRAWEQRATAQPLDLKAEGEFHATGYSADALTPEQAATLSAGQVITLGQPVSVVPRQGDLPPDSPVVVEIQGRVTVTPMGSVVQPGRLYEVVSVEHHKDAVENQGTREWTFVQLREREV